MSSLTNKDKDTAIAWLISATAFLFLMPIFVVYIIFSFGFVLSYLWLWFVVPLGVPPIGILHSYGLSLVVLMMTLRPSIRKNEEKEIDKGKVVGVFLSPWISLLVGYVVQRLM
jgi:hypothetical protein